MRAVGGHLFAGFAIAAAAFGAVALPPRASAEAVPLAARVLWWRGDHVYAAALDSTAVAPGTRLTILDRRRQVATAEVSGLFDRVIIAARLMSGSLERVKKPERLRVLAEAPVLPTAAVLRVGYLRAPRSTVFYACGRVRLSESGRGIYRVADSTDVAYRLVRREGFSRVGVPWPDTLVTRLFDDVPDMEIALERGDLEAAVFWPGEASAHIREAMRWDGALAGVRSRGTVTISAGSDSAALDSMARSPTLQSDLARLNREFFRGDLLFLEAATRAGDSRGGTVGRIVYVPRGPYSGEIERFLNRDLNSNQPRPGAGVVSIEYRDEPPGAGDSPFRRSVFAIRCPVIATPGFRATIAALGPDALVNLFDCVPSDRP